MIAQAYKCL